MKYYSLSNNINIIATCFLLFLISSSTVFATRLDSPTANFFLTNSVVGKGKDEVKEASKSIGSRRSLLEIAAGSRLPDCLHACGSCSPCRLVTVSFACAIHTEEAESCPVSYRCMCNSKSYPIP